MKVISIWQPWASLIVQGHKFIETRGWPAPKSLIGQTIGIAATKQIKHEQRAAMSDPDFARFYRETEMPDLDSLPHGCVLGTVLLHSSDPITDEDLEDLTDEELAFGWYTPGRYAWRLRQPKPFARPIPAMGKQGVWDWSHPDGEAQAENPLHTLPKRTVTGRHLYVV
ncbi:ASCH domain-containing protein [Faunimonas pinastri]|uniref:ASCH domain-containing protein n=2 Tax=Faunimonas pinastri TaxID=1855383 RepID=A0A1H9MYJ7_9HYPH|nr:ASCH domain-containing protein [Faunimonas pinastri]